MNILNDRIFSNIPDLIKAKYIKRTGSPGNYKYEYEEEKTGKKLVPYTLKDFKKEMITTGKLSQDKKPLFPSVRRAKLEYEKTEIGAWNEYNEKLRTIKNEKEADKLYQKYVVIEKEAGRKLDESIKTINKIPFKEQEKKVLEQAGDKEPDMELLKVKVSYSKEEIITRLKGKEWKVMTDSKKYGWMVKSTLEAYIERETSEISITHVNKSSSGKNDLYWLKSYGLQAWHIDVETK